MFIYVVIFKSLSSIKYINEIYFVIYIYIYIIHIYYIYSLKSHIYIYILNTIKIQIADTNGPLKKS